MIILFVFLYPFEFNTQTLNLGARVGSMIICNYGRGSKMTEFTWDVPFFIHNNEFALFLSTYLIGEKYL